MININCPLCDGHLFEGDACGTCHAPAAVVESIIYRDTAPRFIGVLGPSGVGKTVYLGMLLELLSRGVGGLHGMAKGPFSLSLHKNLVLALERQRFPDKTPSEADRWDWVHCEVATGKKNRVFDIVTPDVAGEAVMAELDRPRSNATIRSLIGRCSGLVILADIVQVVAEGQGQELFAMQLVSYLDSLYLTRRRSKLDVPVAIVFTKTDLFEGVVNDPDAFARTNAPALWRLCDSRLKHYKFYCSGVAGSTGRLIDRDGFDVLIPLRIEPHGIVEPFAWLLSQIR
jgi:double-GTPase-like protein